MATFNQVILMGNVTRTPELHQTPRGKAVVDVGLALNERVPDGQGGYTERVTYIDVTFWEKQAEIVAKYVEKGHLFHCTGKLDQHVRVVNEGKPDERQERKTKVTGISFQLMPNARRTEERGGKYAPAPPAGRQESTHPGPLEGEDEIPF